MINSIQVQEQLLHIGANPMARVILDTNFAVADQSSIIEFWAKYYEALKALDLRDWDEEDWDCDDFAIFAWAYMRLAYRRTNKREGKKPGMGINFGIFGYENGQGNHMINFSPTPEGVIFYEPQPQNGICGMPVKMTQSETVSCFAYAI